VLRTAPEPQIGIVRLAGTVDAAAHHGDGQSVVLSISSQLLDPLGQVDKRFVFHSRATGAGDDVQAFLARRNHRTHAARGDLRQNLPANVNLFRFARVGNRQGNPDRVANAAADELLQRDPRLDDSIRRKTGLRDAQMQRNVGAAFGKSAIDFDDLQRVRILQRDAIAGESDRIQQFAVLPSAMEHRRDGIARVVPLSQGRVHAAAINANPQRAVVLLGDGRQVADLFLPRLVPLVVMQMAGVIADLVNVRRHEFRQTVVLLQIHGQIGGALPADLRERRGVLGAVSGDPDHIRSGRGQRLDLGHRGIDILSPRGRHALDRHGLTVSDHDGTDPDGTSGISWVGHGLVRRFRGESWLAADISAGRYIFSGRSFPGNGGDAGWSQALLASSQALGFPGCTFRSPAFPKKPGFLPAERNSRWDSD